MKKAMLITVGSGPGVENALAFTIRKHNPDRVWFCTSETTRSTVDKVREIMGSKLDGIDTDCRVTKDANINNIDILFTEFCALIEELYAMGYAADEIMVDFTSGTKPMSAAISLAGITYKIDSLCYIYSDTRDPLYGRSDDAGMAPYSITPDQVYSRQRIQMAKQYMNKYQFSTAIDLLTESIHPRFREEAGWLKKLAEAYDAWDKFLFEKARELMEQLATHPETALRKCTDEMENYKKQLRALQYQSALYNKAVESTLKGEPITEGEKLSAALLAVADLVDNARRRKAEGKYDDAVARLYRALEYLGQQSFLKSTGFTTTKTPVERLPLVLKQEWAIRAENGKITLGLFQTFSALAVLGVEIGLQFMQQEKYWRSVLEKRNSSILAHGLQPVLETDFNRFLDMLLSMMPGYQPQQWMAV